MFPNLILLRANLHLQSQGPGAAKRQRWRRYSVPWSFLCLLSPDLLTHSAAGPHLHCMRFAASISAEVLLAAVHIPHQFCSSLGLPKCVLETLDSSCMPLLGHLSQLLPFAHFPFMLELCQEFLVHPCRSPASLVWLPAQWDGPFSGSDIYQCQFHSSAYLHFVLLWWLKS